MRQNIKNEKFWDKKILGWERDRYFSKNIFLKQNSVKYRLYIAKKLLKKFVKNKKILELGCGSGLLAKSIIKYGAKSYMGYDISGKAINNAKEKYKNHRNKIQFYQSSVHNIKNVKNFDIIFSLGLIDWLSEIELNHLASISKNKKFLHSFSERKISFLQIIHQIYVFLYYGYKNTSYTPRYDTRKKIKKIFNNQKIIFFSNRKLSFGTIFHNLNNENNR